MSRARLTALATRVPPALVLLALALAARSPLLAPGGALPLSGESLAWGSIGVVAALHKPLGGGTLGLGTVVLAAAIARLGAVPAAILAGLTLVAAEASRGVVEGRSARHVGARRGQSRPGSGKALSVVARLAPAAGATLAAAVAATTWISPAGLDDGPATIAKRTLLPAAAYVAGFVLLVLGPRLVRMNREPQGDGGGPRGATVTGRLVGDLRPLGLDAAGWVLGTILAEAAPTLGWFRVGVFQVAVALLAAEAARNATLRRVSDHRVGNFERVQQAHVRILGETSGMGEIAEQILVECRNVLPVEWFQFELVAAHGGDNEPAGTSWSAGPDAVLYPGRPQPPDRPAMLPGVHRRADWRVIENALAAEGETLAVVRLWCDPRRIKSEAEELLSTLVPQMASSVHRARLDREAKLDPLTGVPVRRLLERHMQRAYRRCYDEGRSMAIIMCDIDFFKKVNDTYGHVAGDEALIVVARTLESQRREGDLCCRYGGEEFALLLQDADGEAALQLAERLRAAVEALDFEFEEQKIPLTLSAGTAAFPELHIKTASELLLLADEALYEAKERGRNRCLLNLGQGTYRAPSGPAIRSAPPPERKLPRIFR